MHFLNAVAGFNNLHQSIMTDILQLRATKCWSDVICEAIEYDVGEIREGLISFFRKCSLGSLRQDMGVLSDNDVADLTYILQSVGHQK